MTFEKLSTTYDVDKVVTELQKNKVNCKNSKNIFNTEDCIKLEKDIEIIMKGAVKDGYIFGNNYNNTGVDSDN